MRFSYLLLFWGLSLVSMLLAETPKAPEASDESFKKKVFEIIQETQKGDHTKATALLSEAEKMKPNDKTILSLRANIYVKQKNYDKALETYQTLLTQAPEELGVIYNLGEVLFLQSKYTEALEKFSQALEKAKATPKDQQSKLPFGETTIEFIQFKQFFIHTLENNLDASKKIQSQFDAYSTAPAYYFANAVEELSKKNNLEGLKWIASAASIYNPQLMMLFSDSLLEKGWVKQGKNPGEITIDQGSSPKK